MKTWSCAEGWEDAVEPESTHLPLPSTEALTAEEKPTHLHRFKSLKIENCGSKNKFLHLRRILNIFCGFVIPLSSMAFCNGIITRDLLIYNMKFWEIKELVTA